MDALATLNELNKGVNYKKLQYPNYSQQDDYQNEPPMAASDGREFAKPVTGHQHNQNHQNVSPPVPEKEKFISEYHQNDDSPDFAKLEELQKDEARKNNPYIVENPYVYHNPNEPSFEEDEPFEPMIPTTQNMNEFFNSDTNSKDLLPQQFDPSNIEAAVAAGNARAGGYDSQENGGSPYFQFPPSQAQPFRQGSRQQNQNQNQNQSPQTPAFNWRPNGNGAQEEDLGNNYNYNRQGQEPQNQAQPQFQHYPTLDRQQQSSVEEEVDRQLAEMRGEASDLTIGTVYQGGRPDQSHPGGLPITNINMIIDEDSESNASPQRKEGFPIYKSVHDQKKATINTEAEFMSYAPLELENDYVLNPITAIGFPKKNRKEYLTTYMEYPYLNSYSVTRNTCENALKHELSGK